MGRKCLWCSNVQEFRCHDRAAPGSRVTRKRFLWTENGTRYLFRPRRRSHSHAHVLIIATAPVCVCAQVCVLHLFSLVLSAHRGPMCVKPRTLCCLQWCLWQCQSVIVPSLWSSTELCSMKPAMYLTGVTGAGISRSVHWAPPVVTAIANVRHTSIMYMSQYLVCMHDESLIEYRRKKKGEKWNRYWQEVVA